MSVFESKAPPYQNVGVEEFIVMDSRFSKFDGYNSFIVSGRVIVLNASQPEKAPP
nr:hypothetical protein [Segatella copri]